MTPAICTANLVLVSFWWLLSVDAAPWTGKTVRDLHKEYYNIFKSGNRNAASHLWSRFLLDRSHEMTHDKFSYMFTGFCAVSGSPVEPSDKKRYQLTLDKIGGGKLTGLTYHCCWPCVCDARDFMRVDTKNVTLLGGESRQYHFAVMGNPCDHPDELTKPFEQRSSKTTTLEHEAPEVRCNGEGKLEGAHLSDHGHIILSMFHEEDPSLKSTKEIEAEPHCNERAANGYIGGMGHIFRRVAMASPLQ